MYRPLLLLPLLVADTPTPVPVTQEAAYIAILGAIALALPFLLKALTSILVAVAARITAGNSIKGQELAWITDLRNENVRLKADLTVALDHSARQRVTIQEYEAAAANNGNFQRRIDELVQVNKELEQALQECQEGGSPPPAPTSLSGDADVYVNDPLRGETDL